MTQIERIRTLPTEKVAMLLGCTTDDWSPWCSWFENKYCGHCLLVRLINPRGNEPQNVEWCTAHGKCKFFPDLNHVPDEIEIAQLWLESEVEE